MVTMAIIIGLALLLMWRVYLHHNQSGDNEDEPGVIASLTIARSAA